MGSTWRAKQQAQLKEMLYGIALRSFRERGYEQTTVQRITEEAGVSKGTFFNHFPTKEHVVAEWYNRLTYDSLAEIGEKEFPSALEAICALTEAMVARVVLEPKLIDIKAQIVSSSGLLSDAEQNQDAEMLAYCNWQIAAGKKRGELAAELDDEFFAGTILAMLTGTSHAWVTGRHNFDLARMTHARISFLFRAAEPRSS